MYISATSATGHRDITIGIAPEFGDLSKLPNFTDKVLEKILDLIY